MSLITLAASIGKVKSGDYMSKSVTFDRDKNIIFSTIFQQDIKYHVSEVVSSRVAGTTMQETNFVIEFKDGKKCMIAVKNSAVAEFQGLLELR
ncbi:MAG: hypothetical protein K2G44_06230 [Clostridia bacterium]|nr:hypothetical protein [Clostridia bacterium]MDE6677235.1 hypothetical protein [Clostridia bacterium]